MQKKVGFSRTGSVQADRLIINNGLTASTTYNFYGLTAISFNLPVVDGTNGQALKTDGAGNLSFGPVASSSTSGTSGTSGANGTSGTSGANGISGTSGTSGANGAAGANGTSGTSGANGVAGSSGTSGTRGTSGTSGANGAAGANGTSGTSGANGAAGVNGTSGTSGQSGSSGTSGLTGTSGTSGANGVGNATILGTTNYIGRYTGATALGTASIIESSGQIQFTDGSLTTPSISFINDTDSGIFRNSEGVWSLVNNGVVRIQLASTGVNFGSTSQLRIGAGTLASPSVAVGDTTSGLFRISTGVLGVSILGATAAIVDANGIELVDGSAATPSISFINDADTGMYRISDNIIGFSTNATTRLELSPTYNRSYRNLRIEDGTAATPGLHFTSDQDTGLYRSTTNTLDFAAGGERIMFVDTNTINISTTASSNSIQFRTRNDGFVDYGMLNATNGLAITRYNSTGGFVDTALIIGKPEGDEGVEFRDGSAATPSISFQNDTDTGIFRPTTNTLAITVGGATAATFRANGLTLPAGSGTNTALRFGDMSAASGIVNPFGNEMSFYSGGAIPLYLSSSRLLASKTTAAAATPNISFQGDLDTGIYSPGDNLIAISTGGVTSSLFDSNGIEVVDGSAAAPSISFISDTDTGIYRNGANDLAITAGASQISRFTSTAIINAVSMRLAPGTLATPGLAFNNDLDTGIFRPADGQMVFISNGATNSTFGATNSFGVRTYFEKAVNHYPVVNASVSGTYTVDMSASNVFNLTLTGNTTLDYSNQSEGSYMLLINQDGTGGRSLSFTSGGKFIGATAVSIGTASNAKSVIQLTHIGTQSIVTYQTNLVNL
jgi:hypothetical protein